MRRMVRSGHITLAAGFPPFSISAGPRHCEGIVKRKVRP